MSDITPVKDSDLIEILEALRMPPECLRAWFEQVQRFGNQHGGLRYYSKLFDLLDECLEHLECE